MIGRADAKSTGFFVGERAGKFAIHNLFANRPLTFGVEVIQY